jgi:hypothetical protein
MYEDMLRNKLLLYGKRIGVSVSESEKYNRFGYSRLKQNDITAELVRYLLINGANILYGGDLRQGGYTTTFAGMAVEFSPVKSLTSFSGFIAWPLHLQVSAEEEVLFSNGVLKKSAAHKLVPQHQVVTAEFSGSQESRYYKALSLSSMREEMAKECDARVFIGGKLTGYSGFYPGIVEEAAIAIRRKQPVYFTGALEGATSIVIRALMGEDLKSLTDELLDLYPQLAELYEFHRTQAGKALRMEDKLGVFRKLGLKGLCNLNQLNARENETLFATEHFHEILYHNLIGLKRAL